ncbi:MAG: PepSY domain-containing protein [Bacteroidales bacterium]|nr:PepSY domain-containing protein [Bacteroidales bacterium]
MRPDGKPEKLRPAMSWLHTWSGLLPGWLLYAVFFTGTLSYFLDEINTWMKPETHASRAGPLMVENALAQLAHLAPGATSWNLTLPGERQTTVTASWPKPATEGEEAPRGRGAFERVELDAGSGERIEPRDTRGAQFLYRFHFELHGIPRLWGRWIVGIATLMMFVAILSGVITHKKIFADFFTFRAGKGARSWLDAHNATAVLALPFHLMITFSGLLLLMFMLMPWGLEAVYQGDTQAYASERRALGGGGRGARGEASPSTGLVDEPRALADIAPMLALARHHWPEQGVGGITVNAPGTARATVEVREQGGQSLVDRGASQRLLFDGVTGALKSATATAADIPVAVQTYNVLTAAHLGRLANPPLRWLLFLSGVVGTAMIGTGLVLWVVKRQPERRKSGRTPLGHRLVEILNVATVGGLSLATAGLFWLNRLLPAELAGRADWEVRGFFILWLGALLHAQARPHRRAWMEQFCLAALLFAALPVLNPLTGGAGLVSSLGHRQWPVAGFDLAAIVLALLHGAVAWHLWRKRGVFPVRNSARARAAEARA